MAYGLLEAHGVTTMLASESGTAEFFDATGGTPRLAGATDEEDKGRPLAPTLVLRFANPSIPAKGSRAFPTSIT